MALSKTYLTRQYQTVYDLAVQLYGDVSKIGILLENFPNLNNAIDFNSTITISPQLDPIAKYFVDSGIIVATDLVTEGTEDAGLRITNLGFRIINTGEFRSIA